LSSEFKSGIIALENMSKERYLSENEIDGASRSSNIRRAERVYPYLQPKGEPDTTGASIPVISDLDQATVEMFPQEGIVVGSDVNSDKEVEIINRRFGGVVVER